MVIEPSQREWKRVEHFMHSDPDPGFDMDILNSLYNNTCIIFPHRKYGLLTSEFRSGTHKKYLGTDETWDGKKIFEEASFVHFSDWPRPKPWLKAGESDIQQTQPKCKDTEKGQDCSDREIWFRIYEEFADRREVSECGRYGSLPD